MGSFSLQLLKKNPSLIPLFLALGAGISAAIFYPLRCAFKSPDVSWNTQKNPQPWNEYTDKEYKFLSTGKINTKGKVEVPSY